MGTLTKKTVFKVFLAVLAICFLAFAGATSAKNVAKADSPTVVCQGVNQWNNNNLNSGFYITLLDYDIYLGSTANATNVVSTAGNGILLNGTKLSDIDGAVVDYAHGKNRIEIKIPETYQDALTGNIILEVVAGTAFESQVLDGSKFVIRNSKWKKVSNVEFSNIQWNNIGYGDFAGKKGILLNYNANLSTVASEVNGGLASTNLKDVYGCYITLNGETLDKITDAELMYHSQSKIWIYAPGMTAWDGRIPTIKIADNSVFVEANLPALTLYWSGSAWQTSNPRRAVGFSRIRWNNLNYGVTELGGGAKGLLLEYDANLSLVLNDINGNVKSTELKSVYGSYITLNGETLDNIEGAELRYHSQGNLWIYAPNMTTRDGTSAKVEIAENTPFSYSYLPALTLFWNGNDAWGIAEPNPTFKNVVNTWVSSGWFIAQYNTCAWTQNKTPTSYSGIKYNGNDITDLCNAVSLYTTNGIWFKYNASDAKLSEYYNGYSHPTIEIEEGATVVYDGFTTTLPVTNFYFVNGAWQTEEPSGYTVLDFATFVGEWGAQDTYNSSSRLLLRYTSDTWNGNDKGNLASKITLTNSSTSATTTLSSDSIQNFDGSHQWIVLSGLSGYDTIEIGTGATFGGVAIPSLTLYYVGGMWGKTSHSAEVQTFQGVFNGASYNSSDAALLTYSGTTAWIYQDVGNFKYNATLKNSVSGTETLLANATGVTANHWATEGQKWINIRGLAGNYDIIVIDADATFGGVKIPAMTLVFNGESWVKAIDFSSIQHNNVNYGTHCIDIGTTPANGMYVTLKFSEYFGNVADATNYATGAYSIGTGLKINGVSIKDISGAFVDSAHGNDYMSVYVPFAAIAEYKRATLTVDEATEFKGKYLNAFAIYFRSNSWSTTPNAKTSVDFSGIQWNATGYGDFAGKEGLLLGFDDDLSAVAGEANGGLQSVNLLNKYGKYITLNGKALDEVAGAELCYYLKGNLWVYAPSMTNWAGDHPVIEIEENAVFLDVYLPEVTLYFNGSAWQTEEPSDIVVPNKGTPDCDFIGFGVNNNSGTSGMTVFQFRSFVNIPTAATSYIFTTGNYITYNGVALNVVNGAKVYTWENQSLLRIDIPNATEGSMLIIEEGTPFAGNYLPGLKFKLVGGVWCKAFTVNITIDSDTYTVYSKDDVPVIINDEYFEALLSERDVPAKAMSFTVRGVTYGAGTTFKALTDTDISVNVIGFNTSVGASVRLKTPTGIRFETKINKADYDALIATYGANNVETGTYIIPKSLLAADDFRSYLANSSKTAGEDYVKVVNHGFANKETVNADGYYLYYGSLVNIKPSNYCTEFFGIGYIKITDGSTVYTVYGGYDLSEHTRTIYYVSSRAYPNYDEESVGKTVLKSYLDGVVCITDDLQVSTLIDVDGYDSPYSITYNEQTQEYTVSGDAEIKSVIIGNKKKTASRTSTLEVNDDTYYITDYSLTATAASSTLKFKLAGVADPLTLVDFALEIPSNKGVKILQLTDTEIIDATQMRTASALTSSQKEEYARRNVYANCFNYIAELIANDRPDLILVTGDIVNGNFDDNGSMLLKVIEFMDSFDIPWAPVFGTLDNASAKGALWQRAQFAAAENCLFSSGSVTGNGDYTIGITDGGVIKRVIYMLDSATNNGISTAQINWVKSVASDLDEIYGAVPAFLCYNKDVAADYSSDFATAHIDGVFKGNAPGNNSTSLSGGVYYTYGTKSGSYGTYYSSKLGGTYIKVSANGRDFTVTAECLEENEIKNKDAIRLVESYDGSSVVTDAYLAPIWDTDRIYDETGLFVGETGSVTLMYTPTNPREVVVRDITLGVTYTYGIDYTISGNRITRVAGGNLPYMPYDEYYRTTPISIEGVPQGFAVTPDGNGKAEDGYTIDGTKYLYFSEGFGGFSHYVTFTYDKTEAWTGTEFTGDANAQNFINKLKTDKEATIFFYGDSITVGCNATGTSYGDYRNPYLPAWNDLVTDSLEELYGANITKYNGAVGGWTTAQGATNFVTKVNECKTTLGSIDLLVIAFGMNDPITSTDDYIASIESIIDAYYSVNPTGSVMLVSPMRPNTQSSLVSGNQYLWESALATIKNKAKYSGKNVSLAKVFTMFDELLSVSGKLSRDYLGNNVNHPNDFGVRIYAQVILKTLCGDDFS